MSREQGLAPSDGETDPFQGWRAPPSPMTRRESTASTIERNPSPISVEHWQGKESIFSASDIYSLEAQIVSGPPEGQIEKAGLLMITKSLIALNRSLEQERLDRQDAQQRISRLETDLMESRERERTWIRRIKTVEEDLRKSQGSKELIANSMDSFGNDIDRFDHILSNQQNYVSKVAFAKSSQPPSAPATTHYQPPASPKAASLPGTSASMHAPAAPAVTQTTFPTVNPAIGKDPNWNNPTPFDGKKEHVESFLDGMLIKFHYMPRTYPDDQSRISDSLSLIAENKDTSYWKSAITSKLARHLRNPSEPLPFVDWNDFETSFRKFFGIVDERGAAQGRLERVYQGSWSAEEYNHRFYEIAQKTGYDQTSLHRMYKVRMNRELREQILREAYSRGTQDTLKSWMEVAVTIDTENRVNKEQNQQFDALARLQQRYTRPAATAAVPTPPNRNHAANLTPSYPAAQYPRPAGQAAAPPQAAPRPPPAHLPPRPPAQRDPNAMEVDRQRRSFRPSITNILCYNCQQRGHIAANCPNATLRISFAQKQVNKEAEQKDIEEERAKWEAANPEQTVTTSATIEPVFL